MPTMNPNQQPNAVWFAFKLIAFIFAGFILTAVFLNLFVLGCSFFTAFLLGITNEMVFTVQYWLCLAAGAVVSFWILRRAWGTTNRAKPAQKDG